MTIFLPGLPVWARNAPVSIQRYGFHTADYPYCANVNFSIYDRDHYWTIDQWLQDNGFAFEENFIYFGIDPMVLDDRWRFRHASDAVLFKLRWADG